MGWHDDNEPAGPRPWREPIAWLGCLLTAVMPTLVLTTIVQHLEAALSPMFAPALFVGLFTVMVLIVRPWTMR
ncbi:hypothetical protein [Caulobacter sp.]|uniref:hypothetical protein n=1 Tax=Caulobacter sp. TaxID=78 RepID=UPI001B1A8D41|nr:hypothetical protein [Caulobacter sp.]MBO9546990.1 hypothetical protein [Caulobacter sp.]